MGRLRLPGARSRLSLGTLLAVALTTAGLAVVPPVAAGASNPPRRAADLPPLSSDRLQRPAPSTPKGNFSQPPSAKSDIPGVDSGIEPKNFQRGTRTAIRRDAVSTTYDNHDGTSTMLLHAGAVNWQDKAGDWHSIDPRLSAGADARLANASGPVSTTFAPKTGSGPLARYVGDGWSLAFDLAGAAPGRTARVQDNTVTYRSVIPGVSVVETVGGDRVKEQVVLDGPAAAGTPSTFRFPLALSGLTPSTRADGTIVFTDASGADLLVIPKGWAEDAGTGPNTEPACTPASIKLVQPSAGAWEVDVSVDPAWLDDPARHFPVSIDPTVSFSVAYTAGRQSLHSDSFVSQSQPTTNFNGYVDSNAYTDYVGIPTGGQQYYSYLAYDVSAIHGHTVTSGIWNGFFYSANNYSGDSFAIYQGAGAWQDSTVTWNNQPGHTGAAPALGAVSQPNQWWAVDITGWVQPWVNNSAVNYGITMDTRGLGYFFKLASVEQAFNGQDSYLAVTFTNTVQYPSNSQLSPADGTVTTNPAPVLSVTNPVPDAEGDTTRYWFRLATGTDAETGQVVNSGWTTSPSFQIPAGALMNGVTYYWKVFTWDGWGTSTPTYSSWPPVTLKVNLRLGDSASPTDSYGPVAVNMATGNVHYAYSPPSVATVGGSIGIGLDYNSGDRSGLGLTGTYWDNCAGAPPALPLPPPGAQEKMVRRDTQVNFSWASPPAPSISSTNYCVEWTGFITLPYQANNWELGAASDDGVRITLYGVNGTSTSTPTVVLNRWADGYTDAAHAFNNVSIFSTIGPVQSIPITIDYYNDQGPGSIDLYVAGPYNGELPIDWLSPNIAPVPLGWSMSGGTGASLTYAGATISGNSIVLTEQDGTTHEYQKVGSGSQAVWQPKDNGDAFVSQDASGNTIVDGEDGVIYTFDVRGKLSSAVSAPDDLHRAAPQYGYDTATGQLTSITDPPSGRVVTLTYQHDPSSMQGTVCPTGAFSPAPGGMLCQVDYGDVNHTKTTLYYNSNGQLARVEEWASSTNTDTEITDFAYDSGGRLASIRDPLAADEVAAQQRADNATVRTSISYDGSGRASTVTLPDLDTTDAVGQPAHSYTYTSASETRMAAAGAAPAVGYARRVLFDSAGRVIDDYDAAGLDTHTTWDAEDEVTSKTSFYGLASALESATVFDGGHPTGGGQPRHLPTDSYGPAKASCFNAPDSSGAVTPNGTCVNPAVPHSTMGYDEGISGLAVTYYNGTQPSGTPVRHDTGLHGPNATLFDYWLSPPFGLPATWSLQMTGEVNITAGTYTFDIYRQGGAKLYIDDHLVVDASAVVNGGVVYGSAMTFSISGWHRVMVDFRSYDAGNARLEVQWKPSAGSITDIPESITSPRYGLETSAVDSDGKKTATRYTDSAHGLGPEFGLPAAVVTDPDSLALTTTTTYETPSASTFVRRISKTMPNGSAATTSYAYYASGDSAPANDCGGGTAVGMLKQTTDPTPAVGGATVRQLVYDSLNRVVGQRVSAPTADSFWSCTAYDGRGRVASQRDSKGVTTSYNYATPGQVTTSFVDSAGTARSTVARVALTGQQTSYTDELGTTTRAVYDQLGRATNSYRTFSGTAESHLMSWGYDAATLRLTSLSDYSASQASPRTTTFGYDSSGRLNTTNRPNGVVTTTTFDPNYGVIASLSNKLGATELSPWTYTYSGALRQTTEQTTIGGQTRTRSFTYDRAARLSQTAETLGSTNTTRSYSYDGDSNRCSTSTSCDGSYAYDSADRLTASPFASSYTYDAHGNVTSATPRNPVPTQQLGPQSSAIDASNPTPQSTPISVGSTGTVLASATTAGTGGPVVRTGTGSGTVTPGQTGTATMPVDGESQLSASVSWPKSTQTASDSDNTLYAGDATYAASNPGSNVATKTVPATGTGTISATVTESAGDHTDQRYSSQYGQVPALSHLDMVFHPNANGWFVSWVYADDQFNPTTVSQQLLDESGNVLQTAPANTGINYSFNDLPTYGGSHTFTLRLLSASPTPTSWYMDADYTMYATLTTELLNPAGARVALASPVSGAPQQTLSYNNTATGNYTVRITSADAWASLTLADTYPVSGYADLTLQLKDAQGNLVAQSRSSSGSAGVTYTSSPTAGGSYTWAVVNNGPTYNATWSLSWTATTLSDDTSTGSVAAGSTAIRSETADAAGPTSVTTSWTRGSHPVTSSTTLSVPGGSAGTKTITPDAVGAASATYSWNPSSTSYSGSGTVGTTGTSFGPSSRLAPTGQSRSR